mmetsp:Transcript_2003/g.2436  ORF Transcript_2003/g.2436 Transcript_2003/m.2436 type:complete len:112 (-) Transcript_2003:175-510(-)
MQRKMFEDERRSGQQAMKLKEAAYEKELVDIREELFNARKTGADIRNDNLELQSKIADLNEDVSTKGETIAELRRELRRETQTAREAIISKDELLDQCRFHVFIYIFVVVC